MRKDFKMTHVVSPKLRRHLFEAVHVTPYHIYTQFADAQFIPLNSTHKHTHTLSLTHKQTLTDLFFLYVIYSLGLLHY